MGDINKNNNFSEILSIIENAKSRAFKAVNAELITMYFEVGKYLSDLCSKTKFGDKVINDVEKYIKEINPTIKGFNRRSLYRMKQFYDLYKDDECIIYSDNGTGRKAYNELIGAIENNIIDRVIINSVDRLCRCRISFSAILAHLADHKVELQVANDIVRNISQAF